MAKLKDIGVGHDYVGNSGQDITYTHVEMWLQSDGTHIPALAIALLATVLISNRLSVSRCK